VPEHAGLGDRLVFVAYVAVLDSVVVIALTSVVAVPMGLVWKPLMHWAARRRAYP
jgi:hypothetical protein